MKVIWKKPGRPPETAEVENTLAALQEAVGGRIETVRLAEDACIVCNEEGWLQRLPYNCRVGGMPLAGDVLLVGVCGEEFCDIPGDPETIGRLVFGESGRLRQ